MAQPAGKSKVGAFVHCLKHGRERAGIRGQVRVAPPKGKNQQRFGGCPKCRKENS